jgi:hypothetical protein
MSFEQLYLQRMQREQGGNPQQLAS